MVDDIKVEDEARLAQAKADAKKVEARLAQAKTHAKKAEDEARLAQAKTDAEAKRKEDAIAEANAKAEAEAQAIIEEEAKLILVEEENDIHSFEIADNLKKILATPHEYPDKHEHQAKSSMNIDSFTGVIKKGHCLRIDQLITSSMLLNIELWFLSKEAPKFTVGNLSDFGCYIDCSEGAMKASLKEDGGFNALQTKIQPNYRDIIIKFESDFVGKLKTQITYNV
jgi:multidrug efflux pump subunit AcrA (membrane-fusion protein)